jgi:nitrogenase molybdenum-iron protein alpha chain
MSENPASVAAVAGLLRRLDIPVNIAPRFAGPGNISRASLASCTLTLNDGENEYLALGLEEMGVPFIRTCPPVGSAGIRDFIMKAAVFFAKEREAEVLIGEEMEKAKAWIGQKPLAGKKVFVELDPSLAMGFIPLVEELGGSISGLALSSLDARGGAKLGELPSLDRNLPVLVAQGQQFEQLNVLKKNPADFYAGSSENAAAAAWVGLLPLAIDSFTIHGYQGIREMVLRLRRLSRSESSRENPESSAFYSPLWFRRAGNWYVKLEVK